MNLKTFSISEIMPVCSLIYKHLTKHEVSQATTTTKSSGGSEKRAIQSVFPHLRSPATGQCGLCVLVTPASCAGEGKKFLFLTDREMYAFCKIKIKNPERNDK